jgi:hypothetical protein
MINNIVVDAKSISVALVCLKYITNICNGLQTNIYS